MQNTRSHRYSAYKGRLINLMADQNEKSEIYQKLVYLPRLNLKGRQLCDLELLLNGGFSPLKGFMDEINYTSVVEEMKLVDGTIWPIPVVLDVAREEMYKVGSEIVLCDEYGKPVAIMTIASVYAPDKQKEALLVYGTVDKSHFGVRFLFDKVEKYYIGGAVVGINRIERYDFASFRHTPYELRTLFDSNNDKSIIGFQTRNPLHKAHYIMMKSAAEKYHARILLHPSVGMTKDGDIDYVVRTNCYIKLHKHYMSQFSYLSLLPLAMRMAGPREALWHAIIRKNYGCTHFIVGRDHAGPGSDSSGKPFYGKYEAQDLVKKHATEIGIEPIFYEEIVYVEDSKKFIPYNQVEPIHKVVDLSGTELRNKLMNNEIIPEWFSFPEVIAELRAGLHRQKKDGLTVFLTGLPSAGKSTIARYLYSLLHEAQEKTVTLLDGDIVRQNLSQGLGYSREDRIMNIRRIGFVASEITKHHGIAICAAIAPYEEARKDVRRMVSEHGTYIEVYISTPLSICQQRDVKGLYRKAAAGKLKNMTGTEDPYEIPENPDIVIDTQNREPFLCAADIVEYLKQRAILSLTLPKTAKP